MQTFTYHRNGAPLRSQIAMYLLMMVGDIVLFAVLGFVLRRPWNWLVLLLGAGLLLLAVWLLTAVLRTRHRLTEAELRLCFGRFRLRIPRTAITGVSRLCEGLPRRAPVPTMPPYYHADSDTLFLLANRTGLVAVDLAGPLAARTTKQGTFEFSRVIISLDDPDGFVAAWSGAVSGGAGPAVTVPGPGDLPVRSGAVPAVAGAGEPPVRSEAGPAVAGAGGAIVLDGLGKRFGDFAAVRSVSLEVAEGEVLAFLGSNGAGKTTTIRMMVGLLRPTVGRVAIGGKDVWADGPAARRLFGYAPDVPLLYEGLTAREFLWLVAGLYDLPRAVAVRRTEELLAMLKMTTWGDQPIRAFSLGMKRKMAIGAALLHSPKVLLLDEVTNGLDPRATREIKDFIAEAAGSGTAVFLTTHLLDVAQELADRVAVIHRGELRALGTLAELRALSGKPDGTLEEVFLALTEDRQVVSL